MKFDQSKEFERERKKLGKRYRSLPEDLDEFRRVISASPYPRHPTRRFSIIRRTGDLRIVKARLACRYLRGASPLRIVYAYIESEQRIEFLQLYFKGDQETHDHERVEAYVRRSDRGGVSVRHRIGTDLGAGPGNPRLLSCRAGRNRYRL